MTIQTHNKRTTYVPISTIATNNNLTVAYLEYMIENLDPHIRDNLDLKMLYGQRYLGNLAQRYLITHADRSAASLFPDAEPDPVDPIQETAPSRPLLEFTVRKDISNGYWLLVRDDSGGTTIIGTFANQDNAEEARIKQLLKTGEQS